MESQLNSTNENHPRNLITAKGAEDVKAFLQQRNFSLDELLEKLGMSVGKRSFLVYKNHKYLNVLTDNIALIYIKYEASVIMCFDAKEYYVNHSLEQIQHLLSEKQFFRLNRQYLINFNAIKEVEHYLARKLLVNPVVPLKEKLLVSKERVTSFLHWLDNR